ncbi:MAG: LacI family DNA-binding transcriptional regulator [Lachnospiraceae bacterium]|nr:LacI family DNA-binding transcriptional regulator [Lachnospiraceae bacterium]
MAKSVRLQDIAEKLGVSTVTVSKALSGQKGMSESLRKEIEELAREMGYEPLSRRKGVLQTKEKTFPIGILVAERYMADYISFYGNLQQLVATEIAAKGCGSFLESITAEMEEKIVMPNILRELKVAGLIIIGKLSDAYLSGIARFRLPVVYLDFSESVVDNDAVISNNYYGAYTMTNYLFEKGHRDIGYVGTLLATSSITDRYLGYMRSMMEHGVDVPKDWILQDRSKEKGVMDEKLLILPKKMPTAFVCNCDLAASMLIAKLRSEGYRVPQDVSVVGYDNFLYPGLCDIGITTYDVNTKGMARRAVHNLLHNLKKEHYQKGLIIIGGTIVEKESVVAPKL